jgi:hypothetical protein
MGGSILGGMGGGGGMAAFQTLQNQQQLDAASAMASAQNTQTTIKKLFEDAKQKEMNAMVEQTQFFSHMTDKINLGQ